jgi:hypothetical protein
MDIFNMAGHDRKALTPSEIRSASGTRSVLSPIRTLAKGKKQVVIIFDDVQRATRAAGIVPFILEELAEAGILIVPFASSVLPAVTAMNRLDFVKSSERRRGQVSGL